MVFRVCSCLILFFCLQVRGQQQNLALAPGVSYRVFPGSWNRSLLDEKLGSLIDTDLQRETGQRQNLLVNGKVREGAVRYNYHTAHERDRFLIIEFDLGRPAKVQQLKVSAFRNNSLYAMKRVQLSSSLDQFLFQPQGSVEANQILLGKDIYQAEFTLPDIGMRFFRVAVWAHSWINVSEIEVWGIWQ